MDASQQHTRWNCRYHIVWAPKFRRKIIYGKYRKEIGVILRKLCQYKGIEIIEANACIDHIHMCVKIPPKYSVAQIMGYLKGKSSLMIFEQFANLMHIPANSSTDYGPIRPLSERSDAGYLINSRVDEISQVLDHVFA